jgi:AcrR family transcriptional regulator
MSDAQPSTRDQILLAASQLVMDEGVGQLTLDAAARMAGVSKGGLLYHFPNKDALVVGMIDRYLADFEEHVERMLASKAVPDGPAPWLRAFVVATFDDAGPEATVVSAFLAALVNSPDLLAGVRGRYAAWRARGIGEGTPVWVVDLALTATDGIWFEQIFGLQSYNEADRLALRDRLLALITEHAG